MVVKANVDGITDPVVAPAVSAEEWLDIRRLASAARRSGSVVAWCVDCEAPMHPKELSTTHTRFFAHDPAARGRECALAAGESQSHVLHKTSIYKAITKVSGWTADVEVPTDGQVDEETGRPAIIDVVASREGNAGRHSYGRMGWEVQLSPMDIGQALNRHSIREMWVRGCVWVSDRHFQWSDHIPWYKVSTDEDGRPQDVVGGVVRWKDYGSSGMGGDYFPVDPFPADRMVSLILRSQTRWEDANAAFVLDDERHSPSRNRKKPSEQQSLAGSPAEHCYRIPAKPRSLTEARLRDLDPIGSDCRICGRFVLNWHLTAHTNMCSRGNT